MLRPPEERFEIPLYLLAWFGCGINLCLLLIFAPLYLPLIGLTDLKSVGYVAGIPAVTSILGQIFFGFMSTGEERFRLFLIPGFLSFALVFFLLAEGTTSPVFWLGLGLHGFLAAALIPSSKTCVTLMRPESKALIISRLYSAESLGVAASSVILGFGLEGMGSTLENYQKLYFVAAGLNLVAAALFFWAFPKRVEVLKKNSGPERDMFFKVLSNRGIKEIMLFCLIVATASSFFFIYYGRYLKEILGGTESQVGISMTLATFFGALAYPVFGNWVERKGTFPVLLTSLVSYALCFTFLHMTENPWIWVLIYALPLYPMLTVASNQFVANHTADGERGVGFGMVDAIFPLAGVLAPFLGGVILDIRPLAELSIWGVLMLVPAILLLPRLKKHAKKGKEQTAGCRHGAFACDA